MLLDVLSKGKVLIYWIHCIKLKEVQVDVFMSKQMPQLWVVSPQIREELLICPAEEANCPFFFEVDDYTVHFKHPNCNPSCPAHRSNPKPRLNVPPTFAEWMQLSEEARTWARVRYGARTPPNDVSVAPSETPAVEGGSRDLAAPGGGELAAGSATGPNSSIGDSAFWALAQDKDSKDWFNTDLNMFASSDVTPQSEVHIPPARSVSQNVRRR